MLEEVDCDSLMLRANQAMPETLDEIWQDDKLGRREDAQYIRAFLLGRMRQRGERGKPQSFVLSVDAGWGRGKSFFLERFARQLRAEGHLVAEVNAWKDDFADDPLIAVMAAVDGAIRPLLPREASLQRTYRVVKENFGSLTLAGAKGLVLHGAKRLAGNAVEDLVQAFEEANSRSPGDGREKSKKSESENGHDVAKSAGELADATVGAATEKLVEKLSDKAADAAMANFRTGQNSIARFKESLGTAMRYLGDHDGLPSPMFVLVDELDRCRPDYAIAMLERIKHLFEVDGVIFALALNTDQLAHSVRAVYGDGFGAAEYLTRFFDRVYQFDAADPRELVLSLLEAEPINEAILSVPPRTDLASFLSGSFARFDVSPRHIERVYDLLTTIVTVWDYRTKIELAVLLPMIITYVRGGEPATDGDLTAGINRNRPGADAAISQVWTTNGEQRFVSPEELFLAFQTVTQNPLSSQKPASDIAEELAHSRLSEEFALLHNNRFRPGNPPYSIIRQYPSIIRKAGRIALAADPTN
jgi:hypothetical protein